MFISSLEKLTKGQIVENRPTRRIKQICKVIKLVDTDDRGDGGVYEVEEMSFVRIKLVDKKTGREIKG